MAHRLLSTLIIFLIFFPVIFPSALAQRNTNPFEPPNAKVQLAPEHEYDLLNVSVNLRVIPETMTIEGAATNTLRPTKPGVRTITLHCGAGLAISQCQLNGKDTKYTRDGDIIRISSSAPLTEGMNTTVTLNYAGSGTPSRGGAQGGGVHWIRPTDKEPERAGFWTQGWAEYNRHWLPTWDYPNDTATSETIVTVPADWTVIGSGELVKNTVNPDGGTRTVHWRLQKPHATYLISLAAGPMDIGTGRWRSKKLIYAVPRGQGWRIPDSFSDTPDMMEFYSRVLGVDYAWPKYAQDAMLDFGGGMENVSASTLQASALADRREGFRTMAGLNAHELAHQWFGDLVTPHDWAHVWLSESFATFMQALYFEHSRGKDAYDWQMQENLQSYLGESRRYQRAINTNIYPNAEAMLDSHSYPKGALVLHTLRRQLGDKAFFAGLRNYLQTYAHKSATTDQFADAMSKGCGKEVRLFIEQWVKKPGHPVFRYNWAWQPEKGGVEITVRQTQSTANGTPVYELPLAIGLVDMNGKVIRHKLDIRSASTTAILRIAEKPRAVLLDPDHDVLCETVAKPWHFTELTSILRYAPCAVDRDDAFKRCLVGAPTREYVAAAADAVLADTGKHPGLRNVDSLIAVPRPEYRDLVRKLLDHPNDERRAEAVRAVGNYPSDPGDIQRLRALVTPEQAYSVVQAAMSVLLKWDSLGNTDTFWKIASLPAHDGRLRVPAYEALAATRYVSGQSEFTRPEPEATELDAALTLLQEDKNSLVVADSALADVKRIARHIAIPKGSEGSLVFLVARDLRVQVNGQIAVRQAVYRLSAGGRQRTYLSFLLTVDGRIARLQMDKG